MTKEDYSKYYIQGSDHYLIPKYEFNELFDEMFSWREEAKELKKQLEKKYSKIGTLTNEVLYEENTKLINQQKEFIEYLTHELNTSYTNSSRYYYFSLILSKYKKIIGGKDER